MTASADHAVLAGRLTEEVAARRDAYLDGLDQGQRSGYEIGWIDGARAERDVRARVDTEARARLGEARTGIYRSRQARREAARAHAAAELFGPDR